MLEKADKLIKVVYKDYNKKIHINNYADIIVVDEKTDNLIMMRYGGYSESVKAMADAIWAGGSIEVKKDSYYDSYYCMTKEFIKEIKKERFYSECIIRRKNSEDKAEVECEENKEDYNGQEINRAFIFIKDDNEVEISSYKLFKEIDKITAIPLLPEFKDYLIKEMIANDLLYELKVYTTNKKLKAYCLIKNENEIQKIVETGIRNKLIHIPKSEIRHKGMFNNISGVTDYLKRYGMQIAERIKQSFNPLFDPSKDKMNPYLDEIDKKLETTKDIKLYNAQKAVAESVYRKLKEDKVAWIIADCGSGKSKISISANYIFSKEEKTFNGILCPGMIKEKWVREVEETLPNTKAFIINNINELKKAYEIYKTGEKSVYTIIGKETARDGYMKKPAVRWSNIKKGFVCPNCNNIIEMELSDDGVKYLVIADYGFFKKHTVENHKCKNCNGLLWTTINPDDRRERYNRWIKVTGLGFIYKDKIDEYIKNNKDKNILEKLEEVKMFNELYTPIKAAYRKYGLSTYINKKMKGCYDTFILDELHLYKGDTGQGNAMAELVKSSKKIIGMTATLINGYSQGVFYLLFRCFPELMIKDNKDFNNSRSFNQEYGVIEETYELRNVAYNTSSRAKRKKKRERQLPGVSPIVFTRFLLENAVFLSLNDMANEMPEYEEIPILLDMDDNVKREYKIIESELKHILITERKIARKILSKYLDILSIYPDQPYDHKPIYNPIDREILVKPADAVERNSILGKDEEVLKLVDKKIRAGEKVLIYTSWIKTDTQVKLKNLLTDKGYKTVILRAETVNISKREAWIEKELKKGLEVLITNPSLVETGLDLNDFTTIIYYNVGYNLFTFRQSSRRSWRINQTAPRVEVYLLCYKETMQERALKLMASKLTVATTIEGNISDEGLAAMSDVSDMTTMLARELALGIQNDVKDIADMYKSMAVLNTSKSNKVKEKIKKENREVEKQIFDLFSVMNKTKKRKKKGNENQMSIFDLFNKSA